MDKWYRELSADGCNLIGEIAGKVVNQGISGGGGQSREENVVKSFQVSEVLLKAE